MTDPAQPSTPPPGWQPPGAPPFGAPVGPPAGTAPAPQPGRPVGPPYGPPPGSPYAPPGARYAPPVYGGGAAGGRPPATERRSPLTGIIALIAGIAAAVGATIAGAIAAFRVGLGAGSEMATQPFAGDFDWSLLSPVRDAVLAGEISFWIGTVLGLWALVQGLVAIVRGAGRGFGIAAVALAVLGPIAFFTAVQIAIAAGLAAGSAFSG